ncbi:hypothetical protein J7E97_07660 [Streptomyces sp. ISL-66]|uniref:hypothetical protein n=1 Tax=Streptomyces sp. ISL-66 TaxID=2819186 RepID=UPI001BEB77AF|nr:hypothetical protein [Streptomyces sp. ISL-66]MBT2467749.1 hypothetical protein [Streptomyces sp. ISL-66]
MTDKDRAPTAQAARRKASLITDQLVGSATGTPGTAAGLAPEGGGPARLLLRRGFLLLTSATLAVLVWRTARRR